MHRAILLQSWYRVAQQAGRFFCRVELAVTQGATMYPMTTKQRMAIGIIPPAIGPILVASGTIRAIGITTRAIGITPQAIGIIVVGTGITLAAIGIILLDIMIITMGITIRRITGFQRGWLHRLGFPPRHGWARLFG